jgi:hypothetical protein
VGWGSGSSGLYIGGSQPTVLCMRAQVRGMYHAFFHAWYTGRHYDALPGDNAAYGVHADSQRRCVQYMLHVMYKAHGTHGCVGSCQCLSVTHLMLQPIPACVVNMHKGPFHLIQLLNLHTASDTQQITIHQQKVCEQQGGGLPAAPTTGTQSFKVRCVNSSKEVVCTCTPRTHTCATPCMATQGKGGVLGGGGCLVQTDFHVHKHARWQWSAGMGNNSTSKANLQLASVVCSAVCILYKLRARTLSTLGHHPTLCCRSSEMS